MTDSLLVSRNEWSLWNLCSFSWDSHDFSWWFLPPPPSTCSFLFLLPIPLILASRATKPREKERQPPPPPPSPTTTTKKKEKKKEKREKRILPEDCMPFVPVDSIPSWNSLFVATERHALWCHPFVEANVSLFLRDLNLLFFPFSYTIIKKKERYRQIKKDKVQNILEILPPSQYDPCHSLHWNLS